MKVLLVFVSALALVARGDVTPAEEQDSVFTIKPEVVAGYAVVAGQEAEGVAPQEVFAEQAPGVRFFGAEEVPRVYEAAEPAAQWVPAPESGVYIANAVRADSRWTCTSSWCVNACARLGFRYGQCISLDTCWCHN